VCCILAGLELDVVSPVRASILKASADDVVYFPIVQKPSEPDLANVVVTKRGSSIGYPSYEWVYGYLESLLPTQNLSITVEVDVTWYPYCDPVDPEPVCDPYTVTEVIPTAFDVTVPGQNNPFEYTLILGKAYAIPGEVRLLSVVPASQNFQPVNTVSWIRDAGVVEGIVRNGTIYTLDDIRVVIGSDSCAWRETMLDTTLLLPGQETSFSREYPYCENEELYVVGQGIVLPIFQK
jgi:hypothetical protein